MTAAAAAPSLSSKAQRPPPRASGGVPLLGHLLDLRRAPIELMQRIHEECGEIGEMRLAHHPVVMLYGEEAQRSFFYRDQTKIRSTETDDGIPQTRSNSSVRS